jgi:hypothetical protein
LVESTRLAALRSLIGDHRSAFGGDKACANVGCSGLDGAEQCCLCELAQCAFAGLGHGFPLINVPCKMGLLLGDLPALSVPV